MDFYLLCTGLLNGCFIPEKRIREFHGLNRYRKSIIRHITSQKTGLKNFCKVPVSVCPLSFLIFLVLLAEISSGI